MTSHFGAWPVGGLAFSRMQWLTPKVQPGSGHQHKGMSTEKSFQYFANGAAEQFKLKLLPVTRALGFCSIPQRLRKRIIIFLFATSLLHTRSLSKRFLWDLLKKHRACQSFSGCAVLIPGSGCLLWAIATHPYRAVMFKTESNTASEVFLVPKKGLLHTLEVITPFGHSCVVLILFVHKQFRLSPTVIRHFAAELLLANFGIAVFVPTEVCTCPYGISASPLPPQTAYTIPRYHSEFRPCPPGLTMSPSFMPSENLITILSFLSSNSLMKTHARTWSRTDLAELHILYLSTVTKHHW